jgi:glycosyltransferase involved in cell wall biosynthesis
VKILVVSQYFWPENFRINDLVSELIKRGHEVTVLTGIPNYPAGRVFDVYRQKPDAFGYYEGARVFRAPMLPRGQGAMRLFANYLSFVVGASLWGQWKLRHRPFDVIFVFEPSPVTVGLPAILLGHLKRAPVVFWALDLWPETLAAIGVVRSPRLLGWVGYLVSFIYNHCTMILGQSRGFLASISKLCSDPQKVRYFPSWAEDIFSQHNTAKAPEVPQCEGCFNVLFAGNVGEAQDLPAVLDAAERLKNNLSIRWLIVGDGRKSDWLRAEVDRREMKGNVLLLGRFPVERMPSFYAHADALLVSLKQDPVFGMTIPGKVQSYLISGIPLLGMLDGEGAEVINQANAGLTCSAGDSRGLADAVLKMALMSVEQRYELGLNGRKYAQEEFGRDMLMGRLEGFLEESVDSYRNNHGG